MKIDKLENSNQIYRSLSAPISLQWELTDWCNQKCFHCYNYWRKDSCSGTRRTGNKILFDRASSEIAKNKVFSVTITGGEPLASLETAFPYLKRLAKAGVSISINTNLTLFDKEKGKMLKDLEIKGILTSLNGSNAELHDDIANFRGGFSLTIKNIRLALEEGFAVSSNMVVTKKNLHDIYQTAKTLKECGVDKFSATKVTVPINSSDFLQYVLSEEDMHLMLSKLLIIKNKLGMDIDTLSVIPPCSLMTENEIKTFSGRSCMAGKLTCVVGFNGNIRPCPHQDASAGSVLEENGLANAWLKLNNFRTDLYLPEECSKCPVSQICGGGCKSEAEVRCGAMKAPDPYFKKRHLDMDVLFNEEKTEMLDEAEYYFPQNLKSRPEEFGGILYSSQNNWQAVNSVLYEFCLRNRGNFFTNNDFAATAKISRELSGIILGKIYQKKLIKKRR